ncbi:Adenosylcobinamide amidohydrolase [Roseovarius sp. THAF8]|uniref:adenosylcobinamide amidohydrolase n=1 Tax=Roseovarius sp. THAF8 TaxID=2587846 RepID=UPI001267CF97|nr:adenosylcobinamide amidohydrolase [Roseovarius sp. THAF8]QFT98594.1 Adenosylcobinamide amidohydrolase [Roseovarius sp. THAF8]
MNGVSLHRPWLEFDLGQEMQVLSWAVHRPGLVHARRIVWREVRDADLTQDLDAHDWLQAELAVRNSEDAVAVLTSRDVGSFTHAVATVGATEAQAVATVGLSNAERVGHRTALENEHWGTINIALRLNRRLTDVALIEAMSIAVQARTAAVMDVDMPLAPGRATGTGTDCIAVAALPGQTRYAGLHTEIGEAAGRAVYSAVLDGARQWLATRGEMFDATS